MISIDRAMLFPLSGVLVATTAVLFGCLGASAATDVAFVSSFKGKPIMQDSTGKKSPIKLLQTVGVGSVLLLQGNDLVGICHEPGATAYRIEGAGTVRVDEAGLILQAGDSRVTVAGRCGPTARTSETGGVLLRSIETK